MEINPLFVDPQNNDFHLQDESFCIRSGENDFDMGVYSSFLRPRTVSNVQLTSGNSITISWTNPTENSDGSPLSDLQYIQIYRNDEFLEEFFTETSGENFVFNDENAIDGESYKYKFIALTSNQIQGWIFETAEYTFEETVSVKKNKNLQKSTVKVLNSPNPFNPKTNISYTISDDSFVNLNLYNSKGQIINELVNEFRTEGTYNINWDGKNTYNETVSSGVYLIKLLLNKDQIYTRKMVLMK